MDSYGYDWERDVAKPLPETVADLAKMFDETKFFGYFEPDILTALMDINRPINCASRAPFLHDLRR
jgi:hypothetical protein